VNWEAIGAVGEVGGAIGVIATLGYLAAQIRQNTHNIQHNSEAVRAATELENARFAAEWNSEVARDPDLAELWIVAMNNPGDMTPAQRVRFGFLMASLFYRFEGLYRQYERGLLTEESWRAWEEVILFTLDIGENRNWWGGKTHPVSASFRAHVDRLLAARQGTAQGGADPTGP